MATIRVNLSELISKMMNKVNTDNVAVFDSLVRNGGRVDTITPSRYIDILSENNVFFTCTTERKNHV